MSGADVIARLKAADREPQPSDGPEYHADHAAWERRKATMVCDFCETGADPVHGPILTGLGPNEIGRAHKGCFQQYEYDRYQAWEDSQREDDR